MRIAAQSSRYLLPGSYLEAKLRVPQRPLKPFVKELKVNNYLFGAADCPGLLDKAYPSSVLKRGLYV